MQESQSRKHFFCQVLLVFLFTFSAAVAQGSETIVFKLESNAGVSSNPTKKTVFTVSGSTHITKIFTYHWNGGQGAGQSGTIGLKDTNTGAVIGTWNVVPTYHMFDMTAGATWPATGDGPPYLYWTIQPNVDIPAGTYEVVDSSPSTWSYNAETQNMGVAWVYGYNAVAAAPPAPQNLRFALNGTMLTISWDAVNGAAGYKLGIGIGSKSNWADFGIGNITQIGPIDVSSIPGTYYLAVKAFNGVLESPYSNEITIVILSGLQAPQNLRFTLAGKMLSVAWDPVAGAAGYRIGLGVTSGNYGGFADVGGITGLGPIDISGVPAGTYYIIVKAYTGAQESGMSNEITITLSGAGTSGTIFTLMTNPTDSQILSAKRSDGTTITYSGTRDANGIPTGINNIQVAAADGKTTRIELDSAKRPARMRSPEGAVFELTYGDTQAVVTALSPDGSAHVSATFPTGTGTASVSSGDKPARSAGGLTGVEPLSPVASMVSHADAGGTADWVIQLKRCDIGVEGAAVGYEVRVPGAVTDIPAASGNARSSGQGNYVASIPTGLKPSLTGQQIVDAAESIADGLATVCNALDYTTLAGGAAEALLLTRMCPYIGAALASVTGPGGIAIGTACTVVSTAVIAYCETVGYDGPPESVQANHASLTNKIINALSDPKIYNATNITLNAQYWLPGELYGPNYTKRIDVPANGPFPTYTHNIVYSNDGDYCASLLDGTWSGTWDWTGTHDGCTFNDGGSLSMTFSHDANLQNPGSFIGSDVSGTGIQILELGNSPTHSRCSLLGTAAASGGTASGIRTGDNVKLAFTLPYSNATFNVSGTAQISGTVKLSNNINTLSGPIVRACCPGTGSITLNRQ